MYDESELGRGFVRNVRFNMMGQIDRKSYDIPTGDGPIDFSKRRRTEVKMELESQPLNKLASFSQQFLLERVTPPLMHPPSPQFTLVNDHTLEFGPRSSPQIGDLQTPSPRLASPIVPPVPRRKMSVPAGIHLAPEKTATVAAPSLPKYEAPYKKLPKPPRSVTGDFEVSAQFRNFTGSETEKKLREESRQRFEEFRREMIEKMECARRARAKNGRSKSMSERRDSCSYSSDEQRPFEDTLQIDMNSKDTEYFYRRKKNNEAAKKSRDLRRTREEENEIKVQFYEMENENLRNQLSLVLHQLASTRGRGWIRLGWLGR